MSDGRRITELLARVAALEEANGNGGSSSATVTADVTTDPDTFIGDHVFDLGGLTVALVQATLTAAAADGETFGSAPGEISVDVNNVSASIGGVVYSAEQGGVGAAAFALDEPWFGISESGALPQLTHQMVLMVPRYVRIRTQVQDSDFVVYAGANHPSATYLVTVEYLT